MKLKESIINLYLRFPIAIDLAIVIIVWIISKYNPIFQINITSKENQTDIISNIIGTNVSLAGFILAALTIIVTFKASLKAKGIEESENALELILSSKHYLKILSVFKIALIEFVLCFVILYIFWALSDIFSNLTLYRISISGIIITSLTIIRSLFILFLILGLEKHSRSNN